LIHVFAIQPEVVVGWASNRRDYASAVGNIGLGKPRVLLQLPKRWKKEVWSAFEHQSENPQVESMLADLIKLLDETAVRRSNLQWEADNDWLRNVKDEFKRRTFRGIVANEAASESVIPGGTIFEGSSQRWEVNDGQLTLPVRQQASAIAEALRPLLQEGLEWYLIDPYFSPQRKVCRDVIQALANEVPAGREFKLCIVCRRTDTESDKSNLSEKEFNRQSERMAKSLPPTCHIEFKRFPAALMHDRFILTRVGGVMSSNSFEDRVSEPSRTTQLTVLGRTVYSEEWGKWVEEKSFEVADRPASIVGAAS
jgi:hypothetical protein